jgi:hypothetical protein
MDKKRLNNMFKKIGLGDIEIDYAEIAAIHQNPRKSQKRKVFK